MSVSFPTVMDPHFEAALRARCLSALDGIPTPEETQPSAEDLTQVLHTGTQLLELFVVVTATAEVVAELGIRKFGDVRRRAAEIQGRVSSATGIDVMAALSFAREIGLSGRTPTPADEAPVGMSLRRVVRFVQAVTASCPTDFFESLAADLSRPELGYRLQVACEALRSFLRRHDPRQQDIVLVVGRLYQRGTIELDDASQLFGASHTDAIALLEEHGFGRTVETVGLSDEKRRAHLARIRQDRLDRSGKPAYSRDIVRRSTIASERIEGIDARAWLGAEPDRDRGR